MKLKLHVLFWVLLLLAGTTWGQQQEMNNLKNDLLKETTDTGKCKLLYRLSELYVNYKPDTALLLGQQAYALAEKTAFLKGKSWSLSAIAWSLTRLGDYYRALEYFLEQLKIEERRHMPDNIARVYLSIASLYASEPDLEKALQYIAKADSIIHINNISKLRVYALLNGGDINEKANNLEQALQSTRQCYELAMKDNIELIIGTALNNLGNIYAKKGDIQQAIYSYKASVPYLVKNDDNVTLVEGQLGLAKLYNREGRTDSALYYAHQSYKLASQHKIWGTARNASAFLSKVYQQQHKTDSAYAYLQTTVSIDTAIASAEKIKQMQRLSIDEQLRQKEIALLIAKQKAEQAQKLMKEKKDRSKKLQLLAIGILIPVSFLTSAYISRKQVNKRVIKFAGVVSILMLFEYITLLIHPIVAETTHHNPLLEILIFICVAAIITPTHHKIEEKLLHTLSDIHEKHKQFRMSKRVRPQEESSTEEMPG